MDIRASGGGRADEQRGRAFVAPRGDLAHRQWGTDSEVGSRFVERVMTVVATCRQQKRDVLEYLSSCIKANRHGQPSPSLPPATREGIEVV